MKQTLRILLAAILAPLVLAPLVLASCSLALGEDPSDDPLAVYDAFWSALDRDYAGFITKTSDDWDALRAQYRETVRAAPGEVSLRSAFTDIIARLNDGHMVLYTDDGEISLIPDYAEIPFDHEVILNNYLEDARWAASSAILTGFLNDDTGYMWVTTFSGDGWNQSFATELDRFASCRNLVLDVRNNGGGNSENGEALLSLFLDEDVKYGRNVFPLGPDSEPEEHDLWIHPAAKTFGSLNLFLLINEGSSSTTDMVIAGLQAYTDAFTIGKPSRAELVGNNLPRELPNGWVLRLGTVNNIMIDDTVVDGDILPVDQDVDNSLERLQAGTDDQLDAALTRVVM